MKTFKYSYDVRFEQQKTSDKELKEAIEHAWDMWYRTAYGIEDLNRFNNYE